MRAVGENESALENVLSDRLAVEVAGDGPAALIFMHGGGGGRCDWQVSLQHFEAAWRVVAFDFPGHGASNTPLAPRDASVSHLAQAGIELMRRHGRSTNALIGHSMGCWVALEAYRQAPALISALVLIECSLFPSERPARQALIEAVRRIGGKALLSQQYPDMFLPLSDPALVASCLKRLEGISPTFIENIIVSTIEWDGDHMADTLRSLEVPLLIVQSTGVDESGRRRPLASLSDSVWVQFVKACSPDAQVELIGNSGHFPQLDQPQAVNNAVERFLARVLGRQPSD
jgi:pimeloyl-ACP methyl ester carboxylesterase